VQAAWRIVEPILGPVTPLYEYEPNSWGPKEADHLIANGSWHNPQEAALSMRVRNEPVVTGIFNK
jgi:hypothetical protein